MSIWPIVLNRILVLLPFRFNFLAKSFVQKVPELPGSKRAYVCTVLLLLWLLTLTATIEKMESSSQPAPIWPQVWDTVVAVGLLGGLKDGLDCDENVPLSCRSIWRTSGFQIPFSLMKWILFRSTLALDCEHLSSEWLLCEQNRQLWVLKDLVLFPVYKVMTPSFTAMTLVAKLLPFFLCFRWPELEALYLVDGKSWMLPQSGSDILTCFSMKATRSENSTLLPFCSCRSQQHFSIFLLIHKEVSGWCSSYLMVKVQLLHMHHLLC